MRNTKIKGQQQQQQPHTITAVLIHTMGKSTLNGLGGAQMIENGQRETREKKHCNDVDGDDIVVVVGFDEEMNTCIKLCKLSHINLSSERWKSGLFGIVHQPSAIRLCVW